MVGERPSRKQKKRHRKATTPKPPANIVDVAVLPWLSFARVVPVVVLCSSHTSTTLPASSCSRLSDDLTTQKILVSDSFGLSATLFEGNGLFGSLQIQARTRNALGFGG